MFSALIPDLNRRLGAYVVTDEPMDAETHHVWTTYLDETLAALDTALERGDRAVLARRGHALKGMGGAVGAPEISVLGEELERAADGLADRADMLVGALHAWREAEVAP